MSNRVMVACDNPECDSIDEPEARNARGKPTAPPYGWYYFKGHCQGPLATFEITCCSTECVAKAIENQHFVQNGQHNDGD